MYVTFAQGRSFVFMLTTPIILFPVRIRFILHSLQFLLVCITCSSHNHVLLSLLAFISTLSLSIPSYTQHVHFQI